MVFFNLSSTTLSTNTISKSSSLMEDELEPILDLKKDEVELPMSDVSFGALHSEEGSFSITTSGSSFLFVVTGSRLKGCNAKGRIL